MQQFDHEKLDAYGIAIDFVIAAEAIAEGATRGKGHADLADQLRRASTSIVLNLAEGAGEYGSRQPADRARARARARAGSRLPFFNTLIARRVLRTGG